MNRSKKRNRAKLPLRLAVERVVASIPEPFDFHQVWEALPEAERPNMPAFVGQMLHRFQQAKQIVSVGPMRRFGRRVAAAKYRRATPADAPATEPAYEPGPMSQLEQRWREFRSEISIPADADEPGPQFTAETPSLK